MPKLAETDIADAVTPVSLKNVSFDDALLKYQKVLIGITDKKNELVKLHSQMREFMRSMNYGFNDGNVIGYFEELASQGCMKVYTKVEVKDEEQAAHSAKYWLSRALGEDVLDYGDRDKLLKQIISKQAYNALVDLSQWYKNQEANLPTKVLDEEATKARKEAYNAILNDYRRVQEETRVLESELNNWAAYVSYCKDIASIASVAKSANSALPF